MKKLLFAWLICLSTIAFSQSMEEAIKINLAQFESARDAAAVRACANRFSLIASKWNTEWVAHYYAALSKAVLGTMEKDNTNKIQLFNEVDYHLEIAKATGAKENDEVYVLAAMIASMRIGIYPDQWQKYGEIFSENIKKAKKIRETNPRIYYLEGMSKFYTPEAFGGGKQNALPYFKKAKELFQDDISGDITKPSWGKKQNEEFFTKCGE
jgi:hypothetical protein